MILFVAVFLFLVMVVGYTLIVKLASRLMSRTQLAWKHCVVYATVVNIVVLSFKQLVPSSGSIASSVVGFVVVVGTSLAFGSWYFRGRAATSAGEPFAFGRALKLSLLVQLLLPILGVVLWGASELYFSAAKRPL